MQIEPAHTLRPIPPLVLLAASCALAGEAYAQTGISATEIERCAAIERGVERLDCYDALARRLGASQASEADSVPVEASVETHSAPADARPAPVTAASDSASAASREVDEVDDFGAELIRDGSDDNGIEEIASRIVGEFTGWRGNTVFRLDNGQVWQQIEQTRFVYHAESPVVTIRRGTFGGYRLRVDGLNRSVRVHRIE